MEINEIKELLELIQASGIEEFEMEKEGVRVRIRNSQVGLPQSAFQAPAHPAVAGPATAPVVSLPPEPLKEEEEENHHLFRAPIVGTFYLTPKPDAPPFIQIGDQVGVNTVLCIIEAMKIFNQIESDVAGEVVEILVENGQPVEYGEALFKIRLS